MEVSILIGSNAYACIKAPTFNMDVLLSPGRSVQQSLRESAAELQEKARKDLQRAERMLEAAIVYEHDKR